ncbi:hypothetical protein [Martelella alba]|uniref:Uncharacterized protein n=1 Tax=Martelella alba TaxID=2590451 RepID=A0ABY2SIC9_9HYPH|nr:hypothetical protein [Martelella alba]TKI05171.1 hypothetical protein FCN80_14865 [Martelella alba]
MHRVIPSYDGTIAGSGHDCQPGSDGNHGAYRFIKYDVLKKRLKRIVRRFLRNKQSGAAVARRGHEAPGGSYQ